jgi:hypothetical protein
MEKKIYSSPLVEVEAINLSKCLLDASPAADPRPTDLPIGPGAPKRRTTVF